MAAQQQETGHVVGYRAVTEDGVKIDTDTVEAMREILRRQNTPGDVLFRVGMELSTLIEGPDGVEEDGGFGDTRPPGSVMYRYRCTVCGCSLWSVRSGANKAYCADHNPSD